MNISESGLDLIKKFEGFVGHCYYDSVGIKTIGYGHVIRHGEEQLLHTAFTEAEAAALLRRDVGEYEQAVRQAVGAHVVTQNQFDALASFAYNLGPGAVTKLVPHLGLGQPPIPAVVRLRFGQWCNAGGRPLDALVKRRALEAMLYLKP